MGKKLATIVPTSTSRDRTADTNITAMLDFMEECNMIPDSQEHNELVNPFTNTLATPGQMHDLLNFRQIGQTEFDNHVNYRILKTLSADVPCRHKRLQTFGSTKKVKRKLKQIEHDKKIQLTCMKKQLVMLAPGDKLPAQCGSNFIPHPCARERRVKPQIFMKHDTKNAVLLFQVSQVVGYQSQSFWRECSLFRLLHHQAFQLSGSTLIWS